MTYGVTPEGFISKPFSAILRQLTEDAKAEWGEDTPTTPDTVLGQYFNIIAATSKSDWDLGQAIASATSNKDTAEGVYLDFLARIVGLSRQKESGSVGQLLFKGTQNTKINALTVCKDAEDRKVLTKEDFTLNRAACYTSTFKVGFLQDSADYTVVVEGISVTVNSGIAATETSILTALVSNINAVPLVVAELSEDQTNLIVRYSSKSNILTTTNSDNLTLVSVGALISSESALTGNDVNFSANSVNTLVSSNLGILSVTNPTSFQNGRDAESDPELRLRMAEREQSTGTATKPSVEASLSEVEGVYSVLVKVNDTLVDDPATGIPAKHFEPFVSGGDEDEIAEVLWKTKSLFGNTFGDITKTVVDGNGDSQGVSFSRSSSKFAWVRVTYSINQEEQFPSDGESAMKAVVSTFGNGLSQGEDFEPTKFYGPLYTISGIYVSNIEIAVTNSATDVPTYQSTIISVEDTEGLQFDPVRVTTTTT